MTTKPKPASREERLYAALSKLLGALTYLDTIEGRRRTTYAAHSYVGDLSAVLEAERLLEEREAS